MVVEMSLFTGGLVSFMLETAKWGDQSGVRHCLSVVDGGRSCFPKRCPLTEPFQVQIIGAAFAAGLILLLRYLRQEFISLAALALEALTCDRVVCHVTSLRPKLKPTLLKESTLRFPQSHMLPTRRRHSVPCQQT